MKIKSLFLSFALIMSILFCSVEVSALGEVGSEEFNAERALIARAVEKTAPDSSYVARLALAALIVNRAKSPRFPMDIRSVIYEYEQFECTTLPDFEVCEVSYLSDIAARDALLGFDCSSGALYFRRGTPSESDGACFYHSGFLFYK